MDKPFDQTEDAVDGFVDSFDRREGGGGKAVVDDETLARQRIIRLLNEFHYKENKLRRSG